MYDKKGDFFAEFYYHEEYFTDYSRHSHDTFGLAIIETGELEIEFHLQGIQYLRPNQIAIFNPDQVHNSNSKKTESLGYYGLHINLQWCKDIQTNLFGTHDKFLALTLNIIDDKSIYDNLINSFKNILLSENDEEPEELEDIIVGILHRYSKVNDTKDKKSDENSLANSVAKYILDNIEHPLTLKDIASQMGYDKSYITRVFKKQFGLTPHAFLMNKKVNQAKNRLLKSENINLAQLSSEVGFYDQSHFNKTFKRVFAKSPKNYKKE